ncbi:hypothetical protein ACFVBP_11240, partial [Nocardioides sp. NPDC057764]|uniref:hypothetical protein n=1 Tax=Nocardioides sp. NPDC057764 TaxID=3346243 RepID=UPI00366A71C8
IRATLAFPTRRFRAFRRISSCISALSFRTLAEFFSLSQFGAFRTFSLKARSFIRFSPGGL